MPKRYVSKLKPVTREVTSSSGKKFKRTYYEKTGDDKLKSTGKDNTETDSKKGTNDEGKSDGLFDKIKKKFADIKKKALVTLGNTYALIVSKHPKGSIFNPKGNEVSSVQLGAASSQKDFQNLRVFGVRRAREDGKTEVIFREGKTASTYQSEGGLFDKIQNTLLNKAVPKAEKFMKDNDISISDLSKMVADKYSLSDRSVESVLNELVKSKPKAGSTTDTRKQIAEKTPYKSLKRIDNTLMAISKHFNSKSDILKTINKYTSDEQNMASLDAKKSVKKDKKGMKARRFQVSPSIARIKSEIQDEIDDQD